MKQKILFLIFIFILFLSNFNKINLYFLAVYPGPSNVQKVEDNYDFSQINTDELVLFGTQLSENLSSSLSLNDEPVKEQKQSQPPPTQQQPQMEESNMNMTDSLTRLARNTIQELCELNEMCSRTTMDL